MITDKANDNIMMVVTVCVVDDMTVRRTLLL